MSDPSLDYDRESKARAYARAGIPTLWIVDLKERSIEVFHEPDRQRGRYARRRRLAEVEALALPSGVNVSTSDLLPPR